MAKKPQTEEKAKGLVKGVGNYKGKTLNLSKKQLGAGGVKAAKARKVDISSTRYDKASKKVLGPKGQPLTGRVDLGGGNIAVYRNGVRVRAQAPSPKPKGGGGGGGGGSGTKPTPPVDNYKTASRMGKPGEYQAGEGMRSKAGSVKNRQGKFQITGSSPTQKPTPPPSRGIASAGGAYGGRAGGTGPMGTPTQQKIVQLKNRIASAKAAAAASAAKAKRDASARAQASRDAAVLRALQQQLAAMQGK